MTAWLMEFAIDGASAVLEGNEDCPDRITLYDKVMPVTDDEPVAVFVYDAAIDGYFLVDSEDELV